MNRIPFDGPAWPLGDEWPAGLLPQPSVTIDLGPPEIAVLIAYHNASSANVARHGDRETAAFHEARAAYLRHRLGTVTTYSLTPGKEERG